MLANMMSMRRLLLCILLCLAIPVQGIAGVIAFNTLCPMQHPAMAQAVDASELPPCCNDADTFSKTGKTCKTGQQCQSAGSQYLGSGLIIQTLPTLQPVWFARFAKFVPALDPSGVWRPPA